jgi:hypothetical protein
MKVMVMKNICTHAGIANGSRGTIAGIMLDEREPELHTSTDQGHIFLVFPPAMLLCKPTVSVMPQVHGILEGLIPMFPDLGSFTIHTSTHAKVQ